MTPDLELQTFHHSNYRSHDVENDIYPENNLIHNINNNCLYFTDDQFNNTIKTNLKLSLIHFNAKSLYANFHNINHYLSQFLQPFNMIAISETWMHIERGMVFELKDYEMVCKNRENKNGGDVALFIAKNLIHEVVEKMTTVVDNV